jgi:copper transport protein
VRHLIGAWAIGILGNLISVAAIVADTKGVSLARGMLPTSWGSALDSTYGKVLVIRFLAMAASLWVAKRPERVVDSTSHWMAFGGPGLAIITYGWSRHPEGFVSIPFGILHMLGISAWFGGAALLTRVVLAGPGEADLVTALKKFRGIAMPALGLTVLTGLIEAGLHLGGGRNLFNTGYGKILILKILAVAAMAFVGIANRQFVRMRLARTRTLPPRPAQRLRKSVRTEILVGAFVLLMTGWLLGAKAPDAASSDPAAVNKNTLVSDDGSFKVEVTFGPKKVGAQVELHFRLIKPKTLSDGLITFTPNDVNAASIEVPIEGTPKYGFGPDQGFVFPASGTWTITVTGTGPNGDLPAASGQFVVRNQDGSDPTPTSSTLVTETTRQTVPDTTEPVLTTPAN